MLKISVVTPSYNQGAFLSFCIDTISAQRKHGAVEYLVLDGGSSDNSPLIISQFTDRIDYWQSQRDGGQSAAINTGFALAQGDILCWINSDDGLADGAVTRMREAIGSIRGPAWGIGQCIIIDQTGSEVGKWAPTHHDSLDFILSWSKNYIMQPAVFWNRQMWKEAGPLEETLHYAMDFDLWLRFFQISKPILINGSIGIHRRHRNSKTSLAECKIYDEFLWTIDKRLSNNPILKRNGQLNVCHALCERANLNLHYKNYGAVKESIIKAVSISITETLRIYFAKIVRMTYSMFKGYS